MAGLLGASSDAPVSDKPVRPTLTTQPPVLTLVCRLEAPTLSEPIMVNVRLAVMKGDMSHLSACTFQHHTTIVVSSRAQAYALAKRMNAVVCGWRV